MSVPLKDLRTKVDEITFLVITAQATIRGITKDEIAREVLKEWAANQLKIHDAIAAEMARHGIQSDRK